MVLGCKVVTKATKQTTQCTAEGDRRLPKVLGGREQKYQIFQNALCHSTQRTGAIEVLDDPMVRRLWEYKRDLGRSPDEP